MDEDLLRRFVAERAELLGYLRLLLPAHLVDDAFQETFLVVMRRLPDFDRAGDFRAWTRGIARNIARKVRAAHPDPQPLPEDLEELIEVAYAESDPPDEDLGRLRACLEQLGQPQRELLRRRYRDGLSLAAIAAATDRTAGSIQVALSRLRSALLACIERARRVGA